VDDDLGKPLALQDGEVVFDGHAARVDVERGQQVSHAYRPVELEPFTVQGNLHVCLSEDCSERTARKPGKSR
jgi:hypothetical protein